ncbi:IS200/IS605 family transposase [Candidatus Bathyarchaeota archaeon]|nr:MAG: IS200/IS605 family transposase [Candidatus Bathyarchaeota archaeon]
MRKTRYAHYTLNYHFVWCPKYRRKVLTEEVAERLRMIIDDIAGQMGFDVISLEVQPDHVHLFVSAPPKYSPAQLINAIKGASSRRLRREFPELKGTVNEESLWTRTYYVGSAGHVSSETIRRYIEECQGI